MKICIDAGHEYYGGNKGVSSYGEREEVITFNLAEKLKHLFVCNNIDVVLTRPNLTTTLATSKSQSLNKRIEIANKSMCDVFISLHCGADHSVRHNGTEVQVCRLGGEEEKFAAIIKQHIVNEVGTSDRGIRVKNEEFLKYIFAPSILIETAFITNENDVQLLRSSLDDFAKAIFNGVCECFASTMCHKPQLTEPEELVNSLGKIIEINDVASAVSALKQAKDANNSLYWMICKIVNR